MREQRKQRTQRKHFLFLEKKCGKISKHAKKANNAKKARIVRKNRGRLFVVESLSIHPPFM